MASGHGGPVSRHQPPCASTGDQVPDALTGWDTP
jgi:hypothetical protein